MLLLLKSLSCQFKVMLWLLGSQYRYSVCFSSIYHQRVWDSRQMKYNNIKPKIVTIFLIHLINTVESSDKVSELLNIEFTHYWRERSLLDFQRNAVFYPLNDQSKSVFNCSLISLLKEYNANVDSVCTAGDVRTTNR
jgi:hypothetical protein